MADQPEAKKAADQATEQGLKTAEKVKILNQIQVTKTKQTLLGKKYKIEKLYPAEEVNILKRDKSIGKWLFSQNSLANRVGVSVKEGIITADLRESSVKSADMEDVQKHGIDTVKSILDHHHNTIEGSLVDPVGPEDAERKPNSLIYHESSAKSPAMITTKRQDHHAGYQAVSVNPSNLPGNQKTPTEVRSSHNLGAGFMEGAAIRCFELGLEADIKSHQWARQGGEPRQRVDQVNFHLNNLSTKSANILKRNVQKDPNHKDDMGARMAETIKEYKSQDVTPRFGRPKAKPGVARAMVLAASTHPKAATALLDKILDKDDQTLGQETRRAIRAEFKKAVISKKFLSGKTNLKGFEAVSGNDMAGNRADKSKSTSPMQISTGATADAESKNVNNLFNEKALSNKGTTKNISATAFKTNTNNVLLDGMIEKVLGRGADGKTQNKENQIAAFNDTIKGLHLTTHECQQLLSIVQDVGGLQDVSVEQSKGGGLDISIGESLPSEAKPVTHPESNPQAEAARESVAPETQKLAIVAGKGLESAATPPKTPEPEKAQELTSESTNTQDSPRKAP